MGVFSLRVLADVARITFQGLTLSAHKHQERAHLPRHAHIGSEFGRKDAATPGAGAQEPEAL